MATINENIDLVDDAIDKGIKALTSNIDRTQRGAFNRVLALTKELDLDPDGNIKQTVKNLRLLAQIRLKLKNAIFTDSFQKSVKKYLETFPVVEQRNARYFNAISESFNPNRQLYREVLRNSLKTTRESLTGAGIDQAIIEPVINIVNNSVTSGAHFADMVKELEINILGDADRLGNLMRYSKQITTDASNQFNADYNLTVANDLELDWFYYSGSRRKTSRPFCKKYREKYFHKKEVENFGRGKDLDGSPLCGGSTKTNLCAGRVKGTNESNIFRYRGGYNCRHIYKPTTDANVSPSAINRNIQNQNYNISTEDMMERAQKSGRAIQSVAIQKAKQFKGTQTPINFKSKDSIERKMAADNDLQNSIKDSVRTTIIVPRKQIEKAIKSFDGDAKVLRVKRQKTSMGYTGTIINYKTNQGIQAEIQINTPKMIYAKEEFADKILPKNLYDRVKRETGLPHGQGHKLYEEFRELDALKKPTSNQIRKKQALEKTARDYYSNFQD